METLPFWLLVTVNVKIPGNYELTYEFTDASGNPAKQVTRTVRVVDTTKPVILLVDGVDLCSRPLTYAFRGAQR